MEAFQVEWTDYLKFRAALRGFDLASVEEVVRYSGERYIDTSTGRLIAVGRHGADLILVPYEQEGNVLRPVTVHRTSRKQILARIKSGRLRHD